jgi:hypothetical protein
VKYSIGKEEKWACIADLGHKWNSFLEKRKSKWKMKGKSRSCMLGSWINSVLERQKSKSKKRKCCCFVDVELDEWKFPSENMCRKNLLLKVNILPLICLIQNGPISLTTAYCEACTILNYG